MTNVRTLLWIVAFALLFGTVVVRSEEARDGKVLTVNECVLSALASHPDIMAARGNIDVAKTKIIGAMSGYYPQIMSSNYYYRYAYQSGSGAGSSMQGLAASGSSALSSVLSTLLAGSGSMSSTTYYDYYTGNLSLSQLFYDFGRTRNNVVVAREGLNASQYDLVTKEQQIILQARQTYYDALSAERIVQVKKEAVSQQQEHLDQARAFFTQGTKCKIDLTKAEVDLAKADLDLIKAVNTYRVNLVKLSNAMGRGLKEEEHYQFNDDMVVRKVTMELDKLMVRALENRSELKKLAANIRSNVALKKVAETQNLPVISLVGSYNWQGQQFPLPYYYYYGTQITFTLFDGYLANSKAKEAEGNIRVLKAQVDSMLQDINLDVKQSFRDLQSSEEAVEVSQKALAQAEENYSLARGRYNTGVGSSIEFTDARVSLTSAKSDYITALTNYKTSWAKLEKAIGIVIVID